QPIDAELAQRQHAEYVAALRETGIQVERLDADERYPDSCFMQDPALVLAGIAILNRMGAPTRTGEPDLIADLLGERFETQRIYAPATLEGGDVLIVGERLIVGESGRTNMDGIEQLRAIVAPRGFHVESTPVCDFLHLSTAATYAGQGILLVHEDFPQTAVFANLKKILVPREEGYAANVLAIGDSVIMPAGYPKTSAQLRAYGFKLLEVPMSEFCKANGGVTCLSLIW